MNQHDTPADDQRPPAPVLAPVGAPIYSRAGQHPGTVKEAHDRCFLVAVRWAFDYWLSNHCVAAVRDGQLILAVDKSQVSDYLIDSNGLNFDDGPTVEDARRVAPQPAE